MSGVGIIAYYNRRLDFDSVDKGMAVGWIGVGIVAIALLCPKRFSLRSLLLVTTLLAGFLGMLFAIR